MLGVVWYLDMCGVQELECIVDCVGEGWYIVDIWVFVDIFCVDWVVWVWGDCMVGFLMWCFYGCW